MSKAIEALIALAPHVEIAAHKPGQIVLKVRASALKAVSSSTLDQLGAQHPGIRKTSFKFLTRKATIDYDPKVLPPELWDELAALRNDPNRVDEVRAHLESVLG
jgi:hypothetical protein